MDVGADPFDPRRHEGCSRARNCARRLARGLRADRQPSYGTDLIHGRYVESAVSDRQTDRVRWTFVQSAISERFSSIRKPLFAAKTRRRVPVSRAVDRICPARRTGTALPHGKLSRRSNGCSRRHIGIQRQMPRRRALQRGDAHIDRGATHRCRDVHETAVCKSWRGDPWRSRLASHSVAREPEDGESQRPLYGRDNDSGMVGLLDRRSCALASLRAAAGDVQNGYTSGTRAVCRARDLCVAASGTRSDSLSG